MVMDVHILQWKYKRRNLDGCLMSWFRWKTIMLCFGLVGLVAGCQTPNRMWHRQNHNICPFTELECLLPKVMVNHGKDGQMKTINQTSSCRPLHDRQQFSDNTLQQLPISDIPDDAAMFTNTSETPESRTNGQAKPETEGSANNTNSLTFTEVNNASISDNQHKINCSAIQHKFTLVTGLINLHRENWTHFRRSFDHYLYYSTQLLKMNAPLVIYVEPSAIDFVKFHRQGKEHKTKIIATSIDDLDYYQYINDIRHIMNAEAFKREHPFLHHPEGFSAEYNILMNSKFSMLSEAAALNVFNTSHFYWIDMAYGHGDSSVFPEKCDWEPSNIMYSESLSDRITYIAINNISLLTNIHQIYKKDVPPFISGGFFGGSMKAVIKYYHIHLKMFRLFLLHKMIDDDQTLAILCYFEDTSLFHFVKGWWFDAFKLFH